MDIHKPKHPILSAREFLVEIFTVTVGICIALGLEAAVQARHNAVLRDHAQRFFVAELTANRGRIAQLLQRDAADEKVIMDMMEYGQAILDHAKPDVALPQNIQTTFYTLTGDAWQTALATQAIGQLPFTQTKALALIYDRQATFNTMEGQEREQWISISTVGDPTKLTLEQTDSAMRLLRVAYAYRRSVAYLAQDMLPDYDAALRALPK